MCSCLQSERAVYRRGIAHSLDARRRRLCTFWLHAPVRSPAVGALRGARMRVTVLHTEAAPWKQWGRVNCKSAIPRATPPRRRLTGARAPLRILNGDRYREHGEALLSIESTESAHSRPLDYGTRIPSRISFPYKSQRLDRTRYRASASIILSIIKVLQILMIRKTGGLETSRPVLFRDF